MMIHILTIHYGVNYGSALQTYALYSFLSRRSNVDVINYIPSRYSLWNYINGKAYKEKSDFYKLVHFIIKAPLNIRQRKIFSTFLKSHVNMTKLYRKPSSISKSMNYNDILVVGSDQVWNSDYNGYDNDVYLCGPDNYAVKKVSYAASIGKNWLSEADIEMFQRYLPGFDAISLREKTGVKLLREIGIESVNVLDPTFLITREEWANLANKGYCDGEYILVYVMDNLSDRLIEVAHELSQKTKYKVYVVTFRKTKDSRVDKEFLFSSPWEFVGLINSAQCVITNSFHGTAFAINLNKQFIAIGKSNYNSRMLDMLELFGIDNHFFYPEQAINLDNIKKIDYETVNRKIVELRKEAIGFIEDNIT